VYDRLVRTVHPDGSSNSTEYDAAGQKVSKTDEEGRTTRYAYDAVGNLLRVIDPAGGVTEYAYDASNNRISIRDANGNVTGMEYDALNRMTAKVFADGSRETYAYDAGGLLVRKTLATGETAEHEYDAMKRETRRTYSGSGRSVATEYSADGLRTAVVDHRGRTAYAYDARGRLTRVTHPDGSYLAHAYDAAGNKVETRAGLGGAEWTRTAFAYDAAGRMTSVTQDGRTTAYSYDAAGNRIGTLHSNGLETRHAFDSRSRLEEVRHETGGGSVIASFAYSLDASGLRTAVTEADGSETRFTYDVSKRLTGEARTGRSPYGRAFTYDAVGNRLTQDDGSVPMDYVYDSRNRLLSETWSGGSAAHAYDAAGRRISRVGGGSAQSFAWSDQDRMEIAAIDGDTIRYAYDADGRKVEETGPDGTIRYLIDETLPYDQVVAEYDGSGSLLAAYAFGHERISQVRGGVLRIYLADGQGSTRLLTDAAGAVTDTYDYTAFGELLDRTGDTPNDFLYTGEQVDDRTGQVYLRARWMDPKAGRFTSPDPFEGCPSCPVSLHPYQYADLSPVSMSDPTGMFTIGSISISISIQSNMQSTNTAIQVKRGQQIIKLLTCGAGTAYYVRAVKGLHGHHAFMKSMGGRVNQPLIYLPPEAHHAFHWILDLVLKEKGLGHGSMSKQQWNAALNNPVTKKAVKRLYLQVARLIDKACKFKGPLSLVAFTKKEMKAVGF
jgi:RHS repeat-associated protein